MGRLYAILAAIMIAVWADAYAADRALLVGIGSYATKATGWSRLHGDDDAAMIGGMLRQSGVPDRNIHIFQNEQATKGAIIKALKTLAEECRSGDRVLFLFSGHGQPVGDLNGDEKEKGFDEAIVPYDACRTRRYHTPLGTYDGENHLIDDELNPLLDAIKKKIGPTGHLFAAFDACYSEGLEMDKTAGISKEDSERMGPIRGTGDLFIPSPKSPLAKIAAPNPFSKVGHMTVVSACRYNERNYEYRDREAGKTGGSLTHCLARMLTAYGLDFRRWEEAFDREEYRKWKVFVSFQHPTITKYD